MVTLATFEIIIVIIARIKATNWTLKTVRVLKGNRMDPVSDVALSV